MIDLERIYGRALDEYRQAARKARDGASWDAQARREVIRTGEVVNAMGAALWTEWRRFRKRGTKRIFLVRWVSMSEVPKTTGRLPPLRTQDALYVGSVHPAKQIIEDALVRRGDIEGVAQGRAMAIVDLPLRAGWLKRDKETEMQWLKEAADAE